jgi:hypothetical protein
MSQDELQLCPKCNKVRMRPTGKVGIDKENEPQFSERGEARGYRCDNDDCGHYEFESKTTENVHLGESVNRELGKAGQE